MWQLRVIRRREFKAERALSVLLLPLRSQNAGLNLSEATHVFLLDVTLERALETQALARVRRLDSTRDTFVHRCARRRRARSRRVPESVARPLTTLPFPTLPSPPHLTYTLAAVSPGGAPARRRRGNQGPA